LGDQATSADPWILRDQDQTIPASLCTGYELRTRHLQQIAESRPNPRKRIRGKCNTGSGDQHDHWRMDHHLGPRLHSNLRVALKISFQIISRSIGSLQMVNPSLGIFLTGSTADIWHSPHLISRWIFCLMKSYIPIRSTKESGKHQP
jgi:hypothetical protein